MKTYIGVKIVKAEPMTLGYFNVSRGVNFPESDSCYNEAGYRVVYEDGYESWSPKDVFEKAYRKFGSDINTVTQEDVDSFIVKTAISTVGDKTTLVIATLANGFVITESSACVDAKNYDQKYGAEICMEKIKDKIWFLLGFLLQSGINGLNKK